MNNSENLPTDNNNKSIVKGKTMYNWETHDNQDKVIVDSINAIERRREHMTDEQLRKAYAELQTGLGPDIYSQLCDRKASDNFQGVTLLWVTPPPAIIYYLRHSQVLLPQQHPCHNICTHQDVRRI